VHPVVNKKHFQKFLPFVTILPASTKLTGYGVLRVTTQSILLLLSYDFSSLGIALGIGKGSVDGCWDGIKVGFEDDDGCSESIEEGSEDGLLQ
jgi:hypothetical protein